MDAENINKVQIDAEDINKARDFMEAVFEIAFGDNAWMKGDLTYEEVLEKLREYSDNALLYEKHIEEISDEQERKK